MSNKLTPEQTISLEAIRHNADMKHWGVKRFHLEFDIASLSVEAHNRDLEPSKALTSIRAKIDTYARGYSNLAAMATRLSNTLDDHNREMEDHSRTFRETAKLLNPFEFYEDALVDRRAIEAYITEVEMLELGFVSSDVTETMHPTEDK